MRIFKYFLILALLGGIANAADGQAIYDAICKSCHGYDGRVRALGKSNQISGSKTVEDDLLGYKAGILNKNGMGAVMKGMAAKLSSSDIKAVAAFIQSLPTANRTATNSAYAKQNYYQPKNPYADMSLSEIFDKIYKESVESYPKPQIKTELVKGEFEKQAEFDKRVAQTKKENAATMERYNKEHQSFVAKSKKTALDKSLEIYYGKPSLKKLVYDPEAEIFSAELVFANKQDKTHNIALKMAPVEAKQFKEGQHLAVLTPIYDFDGNSVELKTVNIAHNNKTFSTFFINKALNADDKQVVQLSIPTTTTGDSHASSDINIKTDPNKNIDLSSLSNYDDIPTMLAKAKQKSINPKKWLFVMAVENYDEADKVIFAKKSAELFVRVAQKKLGIDERHTYAFIDDKATTTALTDKLDRFIRAIESGDTVYFYYSGHGIPSPTDGEAYFLPKDKVVDYVTKEKELMASKIYQKLGASKAGKVVAFVDACFSGRTDNKSTLKGVAAGVFKSKAVEFDKNKMVVISAGSSKQFSNSYDEKEHRMFSYFLMKNLLENDAIDLDLLYKKTAVQVKEASFKKGDTFVQEPQIDGNNKLGL